MKKERTKFKSILQAKCPCCREGEMFTHATYSFNYDKMHKNCLTCNLRYEVELGFFWGAMYISYAFSVAIIGTVLVVSNFVFEVENAWIYIGNILVFLAALYPLSFRYSRVFMLHFFGGVDYQPLRDN
jgi:uncharacterized protein (DUF983 family)